MIYYVVLCPITNSQSPIPNPQLSSIIIKKIIQIYKNNKIIKVEENQINNINLGTYYENDTFRVKSDNISIKQNKPKGKSSGIRNILIITLDLNGNVNLYKNKSEVTLFNLYNIRDISQDLKDKQFFSMGYAYYIKSNLNYFCISSDHGCFIIKKNDIDNDHNNNWNIDFL